MVDLKEPNRGSVTPTRIAALVVVFLLAGGLGYAIVPLSVALNGSAPQVQWSSVGALFVIAIVVFFLANSTHRTVHRERRYMDARRAVRLLLLAKASAWTGAILAGGYLGFGLQFIDELNIPVPQERVIRSVCAAIAATLIVVAGLLLERACRVPKDKNDDKGPRR